MRTTPETGLTARRGTYVRCSTLALGAARSEASSAARPQAIHAHAPCCRSHVLPQGERQPVPPLSACRRLLADVEPALSDAQTLAVADCPIRHLAPSPDQDRRARDRAEDDDPASPADSLPPPRHPGRVATPSLSMACSVPKQRPPSKPFRRAKA